MADSEQRMDGVRATRRAVLGGAAAIGAGVALSACSGPEVGDATDTATSPEGGTTGSTGAATSGAGGSAVAATTDVPVGSGIIIAAAKAVITQPESGEFRAFSSICTHKGCPVTKIAGDTISCACHGSQFSTTDGAVKHGPATQPLASRVVSEKDGELFLS